MFGHPPMFAFFCNPNMGGSTFSSTRSGSESVAVLFVPLDPKIPETVLQHPDEKNRPTVDYLDYVECFAAYAVANFAT